MTKCIAVMGSGEGTNFQAVAEYFSDKDVKLVCLSDNLNARILERAKNLGIENVSTHSLRHTYGTRCIESGMRAVALQRLMGHTDISVTLNTYTSIFNKYKEQELEKVNEYYLNNDIVLNKNLLNPSEVIERD